MSFDIEIVNGDLTFDEQGRASLVRGNNKLVQTVLKLISTSTGGDAFSPDYGVGVLSASPGSTTTATLFAPVLEADIIAGLQKIQREQQSLAQQQVLTPGEVIQNIDSVQVAQDLVEPRQFNVFIELTTLERTPITVTTAIRT